MMSLEGVIVKLLKQHNGVKAAVHRVVGNTWLVTIDDKFDHVIEGLFDAHEVENPTPVLHEGWAGAVPPPTPW